MPRKNRSETSQRSSGGSYADRSPDGEGVSLEEYVDPDGDAGADDGVEREWEWHDPDNPTDLEWGDEVRVEMDGEIAEEEVMVLDDRPFVSVDRESIFLDEIDETDDAELIAARKENVGAEHGNPDAAPIAFSEGFDPDDVAAWVDPEEYGIEQAASTDHMEVGILPGHAPGEIGDNGLVFKFNYTEEAVGRDDFRINYGRQRAAGAAAAEHLDASVPEHVGTPDEDGYVMVEGLTDGTTVDNADEELVSKIDYDDYVTESAKQLLIGNEDCHVANVFVKEDGSVHHHDLDQTCHGPDADPDGVPFNWAMDNMTRITDVDGLSWDAGEDELQSDIVSEAQSIAQSMSDTEIDRMVADAANAGDEEAANEIRETVEHFRAGKGVGDRPDD